MLVEATGDYDDSETGVGSFELYYKDISALKEKYKNDLYAYPLVVEEFEENKIGYLNDATRWVQILKEMRIHFQIKKVGVFYFGGYTTTELMKFPVYIRKECSTNELTSETLIKLTDNEILFIT